MGTNSAAQTLDLTVQTIVKPEGLRGMVMAVFTDVATSSHMKTPGKTRHTPTGATRLAEMEEELRQAREEIAVHQGGDADVPGGTEIHQRGTSICKRRADHFLKKRCSP